MRTVAEPKAEAKIAPSRRGKKPVMLYLEPEQAKRLKVLAAENETTIQALGLEASICSSHGTRASDGSAGRSGAKRTDLSPTVPLRIPCRGSLPRGPTTR